MSDRTPPPVRRPVVATGAVKVSRFLWVAGFLMGLIAVVFGFLSRIPRIEALGELVAGLAPDQSQETLETVANAVFWSSLAAIGLIIGIEALLLRSMLRRNGGVRWAQAIVLLLHAAMAVVADAFIGGSDGEGLYIRLFLAAQLVLAVAGFIVSLLPPANGWFRGERQPGRPAG